MIFAISTGLYIFCERASKEYENACVASIYLDMLKISEALSRWSANHDGKLPESLKVLVPDYISKDVLFRPAHKRWLSQQVLVPENPYTYTVSNGTNLVLCSFFGGLCSQLEVNSKTKEVSFR